MNGFRTWRAAACDRCHGANQEGLVGPSLVNSLKTLTKEEFVKTVREGRLEKGMQMVAFSGNSPTGDGQHQTSSTRISRAVPMARSRSAKVEEIK